MSLMASMQAASLALLSSQGQPVTLTPPVSGSYNVATSAFTGTSTPVSTVGVILPLSRGLTHMPGTDIQTGDKQLLLPGNIAQPLVDTQVLIGGKTYTLVEVNAVSGAYYDCIARGPQ